MNNSEISIRWTKGKGPGGQNRNKLENCCVMTHIPTGITVTIDGRSRPANEKKARRELKKRLKQVRLDQIAERRKQRRDEKIRDNRRVRTYDYSRGVVTDHRTGKTASIKDVLEKGLLDKLR